MGAVSSQSPILLPKTTSPLQNRGAEERALESVPNVQLEGRIDSPDCPPQLLLLASVPSHAWARAFELLGRSRDCARAAIAFLGCTPLRTGELGEPSLWNSLTTVLWGSSTESLPSSRSDGPLGTKRPFRQFLRMASSAHEGWQLWAALGGGFLPVGQRRPRTQSWEAVSSTAGSSNVRHHATPGFAAHALAASPGLLAAAARGEAEVRLFGEQLQRLPPVRCRAKVEALALAPEGGECLAVGAGDGQVELQSLIDPERAPVKLYKIVSSSLPRQRDAMAYAGLQFLARNHLLVAGHGDRTAAIVDVEAFGQPPLAVAAVGGNAPGWLMARGVNQNLVLLLDLAGRARLWDVRARADASLATINFPGQCCTAAAVDESSGALAAWTEPGTLHWADLRSPQPLELPVPMMTDVQTPLLEFAPRGCLLACWPSAIAEHGVGSEAQQQSPHCINAATACLFATSTKPLPIISGPCQAVPLASCRSPGQGPLFLSLARVGKIGRGRQVWHTDITAIGLPAPMLLRPSGSSDGRLLASTTLHPPAAVEKSTGGKSKGGKGHRRAPASFAMLSRAHGRGAAARR